MAAKRASAIERIRSVNSALIPQVNTNVPPDDRKKTSTKNLAQSCPFRTEDIDRNLLVKRQDMDSCLNRLSARDDVHGVLVSTIDGRILYECENLKQWIPALGPLCSFARHLVRNHDPDDTIKALRLKTKNYEIIITIREEQLLMVMQMVSNNRPNDTHIDTNMFEEDWQAFLKRIQPERIDNE